MNELNAVSPRFCADTRDLSDLIAEFGPYMGRYIANYPKNWSNQLKAHLAELSPVSQLSATELLNPYRENSLNAALINIDTCFDEKKDWNSNVIEANKKKLFSEVIGDFLDPGPFSQWNEKLEEFRHNRQRSIVLKGKVGEYLSVITPLLKKGPAAYFVDPYFRPLDNSGIHFISKAFEIISNSDCFEIHFYIRAVNALTKDVFSKDKNSYLFSEFKQRAMDELKRFIPSNKNKRLVINLVNDALKTPELHNRFFITKYGGMDFGKGFSQFDLSTAQIPVHIIDKAIHLELVDLFINQGAKFTSTEKIIID